MTMVFDYTPLGLGGMSYCNQTPFPLREGRFWARDYLKFGNSYFTTSAETKIFRKDLHQNNDTQKPFNLCNTLMHFCNKVKATSIAAASCKLLNLYCKLQATELVMLRYSNLIATDSSN